MDESGDKGGKKVVNLKEARERRRQEGADSNQEGAIEDILHFFDVVTSVLKDPKGQDAFYGLGLGILPNELRAKGLSDLAGSQQELLNAIKKDPQGMLEPAFITYLERRREKDANQEELDAWLSKNSRVQIEAIPTIMRYLADLEIPKKEKGKEKGKETD